MSKRAGTHKIRHHHTRHYHKTNAKILQSISTIAAKQHSLASIKIRTICHYAKISVSTFYRHFRNLLDFSSWYKSIYLKELAIFAKVAFPEKLTPQQTFEKVFIFIYRHRKIIRLELATYDIYLLSETFHVLRPVITRQWNNYGAKTNDFIYNTYSSYMMQLVIAWCWQSNFNSKDIPRLSRLAIYVGRATRPVLATAINAC